MTEFKTEADLCAAFLAWLPKGWTAYPETGDFDILLSRDDDGFQIGVEAKLRLNPVVVAQVLETDFESIGPDCRAVLVPRGKVVAGMEAICEHLAVTVIKPGSYGGFVPSLPKDDFWHRGSASSWHELCPLRRVPLPDYVPDVAAGVAGPLKLTRWKIGAIKIAVLCERRGFVTRKDFRAIGIDPRRWLDGGWLRKGGAGLVWTGTGPDFKRQHSRVYGEIVADFDAWAPGVDAAGLIVQEARG